MVQAYHQAVIKQPKALSNVNHVQYGLIESFSLAVLFSHAGPVVFKNIPHLLFV